MKNNFEEFSDHIYDVIFNEAIEYMSDILGLGDFFPEQYHDLHWDIMCRVVEKMYNDMNKK